MRVGQELLSVLANATAPTKELLSPKFGPCFRPFVFLESDGRVTSLNSGAKERLKGSKWR